MSLRASVTYSVVTNGSSIQYKEERRVDDLFILPDGGNFVGSAKKEKAEN
jgi:hypothetical protein